LANFRKREKATLDLFGGGKKRTLAAGNDRTSEPHTSGKEGGGHARLRIRKKKEKKKRGLCFKVRWKVTQE